MRFVLLWIFILVFRVCLNGQVVLGGISPKKHEILFNSEVEFKWSSFYKGNQNGFYDLTVALDSSFSNILHQSQNLTRNTDTIKLSQSSTYYWKVEYIEQGNIKGIKEVERFTYVDVFSWPNMSLYFRGDTGVTLGTNDNVQRWANLADTSNSAIQYSISEEPTFIDSVINNLPVLRFDGINDLLQVNKSSILADIYVISNWRGGNNFSSFAGLLTGQFAFTIFGAQGSTSSFAASSLYPTITIDGLSTRSFLPMQEFKVIRASRSSGFAFSNLNIGRDRTFSSRHWNGDVAELLAFSVPLSDSSRSLVESYFCSRYSKKLNLGEDIVVQNGFCDTLLQVDTGYSTYRWSNGDTTSFSLLSPGNTYQLTVTGRFGCEFVDEIAVVVPLKNEVNQFLCLGDTFIYNTNLPTSDYSFLWSNGSTDSSITITQEGNYNVTITDNNACSYVQDKVEVSYDTSLVEYTLGNDTSLCSGNQISLLNDSSFITSYQWSTGSTLPTIPVDTSGTYTLRIGNGKCFKTDTISIVIKGQAPIAEFTFSNLCQLDSVQFTDVSTSQANTNIIRWNWNFGDGTTSNIQNPKHLYDTAGNYTVTLEVENDAGCIGLTSKSIGIFPIPEAHFTALDRCVLDSVRFINSTTIKSGSISSYKWDFGDIGNADSAVVESPKYLYFSSGVYSVRLIAISNEACKDTSIKTVTINPKPQVDFSFSGTTINDSTFFSNASTISSGRILTYNWSFGDGQNSTLENPKILYQNIAAYPVTLSAVSDSACQSDTQKIIRILDPPPTFRTVYPKEKQVLSSVDYLQWNKLDTAKKYEIQISTDSSFVSLEYSITIGKKNILNSLNLSLGKKFWRVIAINGQNFDTTNIASFSLFSVSEIDSVNLWIKADTGIQISSSFITQWNDLSDSLLVLNQPNVSKQPSLLLNELNHYPVVEFDNVDDQFNTGIRLSNGNFSFFSVYNSKEQSNRPIQVLRGSNNWFYGPYQGNHRVFNSSMPISGKTLEKDRYVVHSVVSRNDSLSNFVNGLLYGSNINSFFPGVLTIAGSPMNGNLAEMIIVKGQIRDFERENIDQYLMDKYAPPVDAGPDKLVCTFPDSVTLDVDYALNFSWSTGDTTARAIIDSAGKYYVTITDVFERQSVDSVYFILDTSNYQVDLGFYDTTICLGNTLELFAGNENLTYQWNTNETNASIKVDSSAKYLVTVTNCFGNVSKDSIQLKVNHPQFSLGDDTTICFNTPLSLSPDSSFNQVNYDWSDASSLNSLSVGSSGLYSLTVTDLHGCSFSDSINVKVDSNLYGLTLGRDTSLCEGNLIGLQSHNSKISDYLWNTSDTTAFIQLDTAGVYHLTYSDSLCQERDTVTVQLKGKAPEASFFVQSLCFKDSVNFLNSSTSQIGDTIVNFTWYFGNGDSSQTINARYQYPSLDTLTARLKIETNKNCFDTASQLVRIKPKPFAHFAWSDSCSKKDITFLDSSTISSGSVVQYNWNFGDPTSSSNESLQQHPSHRFDTLGDYRVSLQVESEEGCIDSMLQTVRVNPTPNVNFSFTGNCLGDSTFFTNLSELNQSKGDFISDYTWFFNDFVNLTKVTKDINPKQFFTEKGLTQLLLRAKTNNKCESSYVDTLYMRETPTAILNLDTYCESEAFTLIDNSISEDSIVTYLSIIKNIDTSFVKNPTFRINDSGDYELIKHITTEYGCVDSSVLSLQIAKKPTAEFSVINNGSGAPYELAVNNNSKNADSYVWFSGKGDTSFAETAKFKYLKDSIYNVSLVALNNFSCSDTVSKILLVNPYYLDAYLEKVFLTETLDGRLEVSARLINSGNNTIESIMLVADLNNQFQFSEMLHNTIYKGKRAAYQFKSSFIPEQGQKLDFVCVQIKLVNDTEDSDSSNNTVCELGFNDEVNFRVYPNPVSENLKLEFSIPEEGKASFVLHDQIGRKVLNIDLGKIEKGYYLNQYDVSNLGNGIYYYQFYFKGLAYTGRIVKL